jgi:hypothetical protein
MRTTYRVHAAAAALAAATLALMACGQSTHSAGPARPAANVTTPTTPPDQVPSQLWGTWQTVGQTNIPDGPQKLVISAQGYAFWVVDPSPSDSAIGRLAATGPNQLDFGPNQLLCHTHGSYTWRLDDGTLYFTGGDGDSCKRATLLPVYGWTLISNSTAPADSAG